ncbi:MAG TPA: hypothetical protein VJ780_07535 [Flavobacterium sp.]|nr:hypothetical protein [Flavobacterium sp.]
MKIFKPEEKLKKSLLNETEKKEFHLEFIENKSIFGIDIYKYSEYPEDIQVYVPVLFNSIYNLTVRMCLNVEKFFFISYGKNESDFKTNFISTGDGGFQIFENPIQSIIFGAYFELNVRRFNSGSFIGNINTNLYNIIDRIELRYCITHDKIYSYDKNFFGAGIINNARILAKDNLNRLLIDQNTLRWFDENVNTIENLMVIRLENILKLSYFKDYDKSNTTLIFQDNDNDNDSIIKSLDILKIGSIKSKNTTLDIYNLKIQFSMHFDKGRGKFKKEYEHFLYTIGNLNTQGIN